MIVEPNPNECLNPSLPPPGCVFRFIDSEDGGVYATRPFAESEIVVAGHADGEFPRDGHPLTQANIDEAALRGGLMGKVAHSCAPNCGIRLNEVGTHDLVARRAIRTGARITVDYAMRSFSIDLFPKHCPCGTVGCRGIVTGFRDLPPERKRAYRGLVAPHLLALEAAADAPHAR